VIILFALGFRASLFIGIAIPASFLAGVLGLQLAGLTVNIVVLFSLISRSACWSTTPSSSPNSPSGRMAGGHAAARGLFARRQAHVRPGDRRDRTRVAAFSPAACSGRAGRRDS
jgi:multidrug efflux pump